MKKQDHINRSQELLPAPMETKKKLKNVNSSVGFKMPKKDMRLEERVYAHDSPDRQDSMSLMSGLES